MTIDLYEQPRAAVEAAFDNRHHLNTDEIARLVPLLDAGLDALDKGLIRAAEPCGSAITVNAWVKKLILLCFLFGRAEILDGKGLPSAYDKLPLKFENWTEQDFSAGGIRVVPGAVVRKGAYLAPGVVLMPSFVNIGAHVGPSTMIDTWATVGSCAQIGAHCHLSGGAGIGGVLEPIGETPVIIEDNVFIGARSEIAEGVRVRRGAVIGMGVYIGRSTPIIERATGKVYTGEIPEYAVVVPGTRLDNTSGTNVGTYAAVIVKYADEKTRGKTALNYDVRERQ